MFAYSLEADDPLTGASGGSFLLQLVVHYDSRESEVILKTDSKRPQNGERYWQILHTLVSNF